MNSDNESKIDLSSVNKTKKQLKFPKLNNPFKKQTGPARDAEGKFASGSGGLLQSKNFNLKRALPLVAVVALVGGYFVFQSFADTKRPNYQYSVFSCGAVDKSKNPNYSCQDYSAEAMVYRTYKAALGREPAKTDYKSWVQAMVGGSQSLSGRMQPDILVKRVLATSEAKSKKGALFDSASSRSAVTNRLYQNTLGRTARSSEISYWQKEIAAKKWNNDRFIEVFINSPEVRAKQRAGFLSALSSQKIEKVKVDEIAKRKQGKRTADAASLNAKSVAILKEMQKRSADNNNRKNAAGSLASQPGSKITKGTISTIQNNHYNIIKARVNGFKGKDYKGKIIANLASVQKLYDEAATISRQSPDITNSRITDALKKARSYITETDKHIANANWLLGETGKAKNIAEKKYNDHQAWLRLQQAIASCKNSGKLWQNGKCVPKPQPAPSSPGGNNSGGSGGSGGSGSGQGGAISPGSPCPNGNWHFLTSTQNCYNLSTISQPYCKKASAGYRITPDNHRCVKNNSVEFSSCSSPKGKLRLNGGPYYCYRYQRAIR